MVKFKSLSSGSNGNCYFLGLFSESGACEAGLVIDAGISLKRLRISLKEDGIALDDFSDILITHDHFDHIRSLGSYCKHLQKRVWATPQLHKALGYHTITCDWIGGCRAKLDEGWNEIVPGRISVRYFEVPHDASHTVGFAILLDGYRYVHITDCGRMTDEALNWCRQAQTVVLESNYDEYMLLHGPYPKELQDRIRNGHGHLSNDECAAAIADFLHPELKNVFLCHLSEHNNTPELALSCATKAASQSSTTIRVVPLPRMEPTPLWTL